MLCLALWWYPWAMAQLLTVSEAAGIMGLREQTVRVLLMRGKLRWVKIGSATMIYRSSVLEYVHRNRGKALHDPTR